MARLLERDYGVTYQSQTSYRTLLQKCGLSYQRPAKQYKSHSEAKVMDFEEHLKKKLMDLAQDAPDTVILAADEASLYLQASLMRVWAPVGQTPVVRVAANRDNTHFYGALNLATGQASRDALRHDERAGLGFVSEPSACGLPGHADFTASGIVRPGTKGQRSVRCLRPILGWKCCGFLRAARS